MPLFQLSKCERLYAFYGDNNELKTVINRLMQIVKFKEIYYLRAANEENFELLLQVKVIRSNVKAQRIVDSIHNNKQVLYFYGSSKGFLPPTRNNLTDIFCSEGLNSCMKNQSSMVVFLPETNRKSFLPSIKRGRLNVLVNKNLHLKEIYK